MYEPTPHPFPASPEDYPELMGDRQLAAFLLRLMIDNPGRVVSPAVAAELISPEGIPLIEYKFAAVKLATDAWVACNIGDLHIDAMEAWMMINEGRI